MKEGRTEAVMEERGRKKTEEGKVIKKRYERRNRVREGRKHERNKILENKNREKACEKKEHKML